MSMLPVPLQLQLLQRVTLCRRRGRRPMPQICHLRRHLPRRVVQPPPEVRRRLCCAAHLLLQQPNVRLQAASQQA